MNYNYKFEDYRNSRTKHICPSCHKKTFVFFIDSETKQSIHSTVGKCDRAIKCAYQYTPFEYFQDNNISIANRHSYKQGKEPVKQYSPSVIPVEILLRSLQDYDQNNFISFLTNLFGNDITTGLIEKYFIGTSKNWSCATLFWQIDIKCGIRAGKIVQFEIIPLNQSCIGLDCKRNKKKMPPIQWVHRITKLPDFELKQCLFGEHLLKDSSIPVAIVESEKTAIISSIYLPQFTWLATGGLSNLTIDMCRVLKDRTVTLFPDVNGFQKWNLKMKELSQLMPGTTFKISHLLEKNATDKERLAGCDLADYLIKFEPNLFNTNQHNLSV